MQSKQCKWCRCWNCRWCGTDNCYHDTRNRAGIATDTAMNGNGYRTK
nr:MAG TPA: hypothetical protein [Caudoviricetes sp.]